MLSQLEWVKTVYEYGLVSSRWDDVTVSSRYENGVLLVELLIPNHAAATHLYNKLRFDDFERRVYQIAYDLMLHNSVRTVPIITKG